MGDYYHVLGLNRNATEEQIRKAYHTLALKFHPDKSVRNAGEQMARINQAYRILSDPERRAAYDETAPVPRSLVLHKLSQNFDSMCRWLSGSVEPYNTASGSPSGKIIVGLFIGGGLVVVAVYMKYRRGDVIISPPPYQPVLDVVTPTASVKPEISDINATSLWTLAALLAALRSKNVLRLVKSTASSQARVIAKTIAEGSQSGLLSAAKTVSSGAQAAPSGPSVNSAVIVVATEKATAGGFRVWTWAAGLLGKAFSFRFPLSSALAFRLRRLGNYAARTYIRGIQLSKSGLSSAATKIGAATVRGASKARSMRLKKASSLRFPPSPVLAFRLRQLGNYAARTSIRGIQLSKSGLSSAATKIGAATVRGASKARSMRLADAYSVWNSAVNRITKVVRQKKVPFKPLSSQNIIYVQPTPLKAFDPKSAPKSRRFKRAIKYAILASAIGSLTYVFLR